MQEQTGQINFDKLLQLFMKLLQTNDALSQQFRRLYQYIIVDEYQDNSELQSNLLLSMVTKGQVTVVGDDDQCICQFRGACPGNFDDFSKHFVNSPTLVLEAALEQNHRSTGNALNVGAKILEALHKRSVKTLLPKRENGVPVEMSNNGASGKADCRGH